MKTPEPVTGTMVTEGATEDWSERESRLVHDGRIAGDRLVLYLRHLNISERQVLEFALRAIREAERNTAPVTERNPVAEAMEALRRFLFEGPGAAGHSHFWKGRCEPPRVSQPPVHRLHMVPEELAPRKPTRRAPHPRKLDFGEGTVE